MTREEFGAQFGRLCEGHRFDPTAKQTEAFYELLQNWEAEDFRVAVTRLLAARGFPSSVDQIAREIENAQERRRRAAVLVERTEAEKLVAASPRPVVSMAMQERYGAARMRIILDILARGALAVNEGKNLKADNAKFTADALAAMLNDAELVAWMEQEAMGTCGMHAGDHTVFDCLMDEQQWWENQAAGLDAVASYRALKPIARAPIREDLLMRVDGYGRVLADQEGALPFDASV